MPTTQHTSSRPSRPAVDRLGRTARDRSVLMILGIMGALLVWGTLHALGAYLYNHDYDVRKPLIVYGFMGAFLGLWGAAMWLRSRRLRREFEALPPGSEDDGGDN